MPKEFELKYKNYKKDEVIKKLLELNAKQIHKPIVYEYIVFKHPLNKPETYIRLRKEYQNITFTYKENMNMKFVDEYEINVSDYNTTLNILTMLGFKKKYFIQKLREKWSLDGCKEIVFDTYPGAIEYMEIECDNEENIYKLANKLNLKEEKKFTVRDIYRELYDINDYRKEGLTFNTVREVIGENIKKNKKLFKKILKIQKKLINS
jgi:predicted adenylyl cyclase CyaB